jgi:ubiquinone/menaquinone biosynthesis C-methylase UbiE
MNEQPEQNQNDIVSSLYRKELHDQWAESKTMEHASGIWGREPMFSYLRDEIVHPGDTVVDLGSGAGYPSIKIAEMVGEEGRVIGVEKSRTMLGLDEGQTPLAEKYERVKNLSFINADITKLPLESGIADEAVSFMVLHNLDLPIMQETFKEVARILKTEGKAVFLTMHPQALDQPWKLDFMKYDEEAIETFRNSENKEGIPVKGIVKSSGGGEKEVMMFTHTRDNTIKAIEEAGLILIKERDLWIDEKTAKEKFGDDSVQRLPITPTFWIITLQKAKES